MIGFGASSHRFRTTTKFAIPFVVALNSWAFLWEEFGFFAGTDEFTTQESERLVRLPLYYSLGDEDVEKVCRIIKTFLELK